MTRELGARSPRSRYCPGPWSCRAACATARGPAPSRS